MFKFLKDGHDVLGGSLHAESFRSVNRGRDTEDVVAVCGCFESNLVEVVGVPLVIKFTEPFVDGQIMKCYISDDFLLDIILTQILGIVFGT